jgi:hypothetical protein
MRDNCGLCIRAKSALSNVWDRRPFDYKEVNITHPENKAWKDIYDFDVPAVCSQLCPLASSFSQNCRYTSTSRQHQRRTQNR